MKVTVEMDRGQAMQFFAWLSKQPQDEAPQDEAPQDEAPQDEAPQDEAPQDAAPQDEAPQDAAPQDEAPQDAAPIPTIKDLKMAVFEFQTAAAKNDQDAKTIITQLLASRGYKSFAELLETERADIIKRLKELS